MWAINVVVGGHLGGRLSTSARYTFLWLYLHLTPASFPIEDRVSAALYDPRTHVSYETR